MHLTRTRVRYGETDQMGVAYHANYLVYFELGRSELIRELGLPYSALERRGWRLLVVEAFASFKAPARYDDEIRIATRITQVTIVRVRFEYTVALEADGRILAEGFTVLASVGEDGKPRKLPPEFREALLSAADLG